jgi:glucan phosphorylase
MSRRVCGRRGSGENFFLFGLSAPEVEQVKRQGYRPADYIERDDELRAVLDLSAGGRFSPGDTVEEFRDGQPLKLGELRDR